MHTFADTRWRGVPFSRKVLIGVALTALVAGVAVGRMTIASAATTATYQDTFESGSFPTGKWTTTNATFGSTGAHDNRRFARLTATGARASMTWPTSVIQQGQRSWSVRTWFKVGSRGANHSVGLLTIRNKTGLHNADLFIEAPSGKCRVDLLATDKAVSTTRCDDGAWHLVEMRGDYGSSTYTLDWRLDGVAQPSISSANETPSTVMDFWIGDSSLDKAFVLDVDDVTLAIGDSTQPFMGSATSYR